MTGSASIHRLSRYDRHCLAVETASRPIHVGILAVLEPAALVDPAGRLRLADIRRELDGRVAGVPELRRVVFHPGWLAGGPLWVDDPAFRIDRHVDAVDLSPAGDDVAWQALVEGLVAPPLDRAHPLWRIWFVTGLSGGRIGALVILHHALADGQAAMRMVRSLLGPPISLVDPDPQPPPAPPPSWGSLVRERAERGLETALRLLRPRTWRTIAEVTRSFWLVGALARSGVATSLNAPVGPRRRSAVVRLHLADAKRVARANECGVNDVVLSLVAGGVRALLEGRGEPTNVRPRAGITVALFDVRHEAEAGNDIGTLYVPLPIDEVDPLARLPLIAAARAEARSSPLVAVEPVLRAWLGRVGTFRRSLERQRLVNLAETYLPGPPVRIEILGAPVLDLLPIAPLTGNLGLSFVALSYASGLAIAVRADADRFPDLDRLVEAMEREWPLLAGAP
jgi:WS/DGAT/MGAT family acyltransferase